MITPRHLVVVGAGIAGLTAALDCARVGIRVTVLEAAEAPGGAVRSATLGGLRLDVGAESYATRGGAVRALASGLGLEPEIVTPEPAGAWLLRRDGSAVPMPRSAVLGIPANPLAEDIRRVIGWGGAIRAYGDRLLPLLTIGKERNLGALVRRRMGARVLEELVAPVTRGVYSADPGDLDVELAAPGLNAALTTAGSLSGAVAILRANANDHANANAHTASGSGSGTGSHTHTDADAASHARSAAETPHGDPARASAVAGSRVEGLRGGMGTLVDALLAELTSRGAEIITGAAATRIEPIASAGSPAAWEIRFGAVPEEDGEAPAAESESARGIDGDGRPWGVLHADELLLAAPEAESLALIAHLDPELAALAAEAAVATEADSDPDSASGLGADIEIVTLVLDSPELDARPRGSGALVTRGAPVRAKALTHSSAKWGWLAEAAAAQAPHRHALRLSYGAHGRDAATAGLGDAEAVRLALADASAILGVPLAEDAVVAHARDRFRGTQPVAASGQRERADRLRSAIQRSAGLDAAGAWLSGTGLASVVPDALAASGRIRHRVAAYHLASGEFAPAPQTPDPDLAPGESDR